MHARVMDTSSSAATSVCRFMFFPSCADSWWIVEIGAVFLNVKPKTTTTAGGGSQRTKRALAQSLFLLDGRHQKCHLPSANRLEVVRVQAEPQPVLSLERG